MSNRTRRNNKGADRKMGSNDSPEIADRGETSEEPVLPSGLKERKKKGRKEGRKEGKKERKKERRKK